jgi:hypothetical protein
MLLAKFRNWALIGLAVLLALTGIVGAALVWVYVGAQPSDTPTPTELTTPAPTVSANAPGSGIPTLPPEWTPTPFPARGSTPGGQTAPTETSGPGAPPAATASLTPRAAVTTQPATTGPASTATSTPTLAAPDTPQIPTGGYPGSTLPYP